MTIASPTMHRSLFRKVLTGLVALTAASVTGPAGASDRFLEQIHTPRVAAIENFVAADRFRVGNRIGGRRLGLVGANFAEQFLMGVESDAPAASLAITELRFTMGDASLIEKLGSEKASIDHLAYVYAIMVMGDAGAGHTDWRSNIAYVRSSVDQRLWAVHWSVDHAGDWTIGAVNVPHAALDWAAGTRVLSSGSDRFTSKPIRNTRVED